jgi:hypothetical protein
VFAVPLPPLPDVNAVTRLYPDIGNVLTLPVKITVGGTKTLLQ